MVADRTHDSSDTNSRSAPKGQLPSLTPLRGLAAIWVVIYHYSVQCFPNLDAAHYTHFIGKGYLAVDMFFMLSGFVMTHVYYRAFSDSESVKLNYRSFLVAPSRVSTPCMSLSFFCSWPPRSRHN
jgi:peptidoglycan/LPS O-acetylase OafA/YrhL